MHDVYNKHFLLKLHYSRLWGMLKNTVLSQVKLLGQAYEPVAECAAKGGVQTWEK